MSVPRLLFAIKKLALFTVLTFTLLAMGSPGWARDIQGSFNNGIGVCKRNTNRVVRRIENVAKEFTKSTFGDWTNPYKSAP